MHQIPALNVGRPHCNIHIRYTIIAARAEINVTASLHLV